MLIWMTTVRDDYMSWLWLGDSTHETSVSTYCVSPVMADGGNSAVMTADDDSNSHRSR